MHAASAVDEAAAAQLGGELLEVGKRAGARRGPPRRCSAGRRHRPWRTRSSCAGRNEPWSSPASRTTRPAARWDRTCAGARRPAPNSRESRLSWSELYPTGPLVREETDRRCDILGERRCHSPALASRSSSRWRPPCWRRAADRRSPSSPTPTPLTPAQIQARYAAAAPHYNQGEAQIALTENASCDAASATVALAACQTRAQRAASADHRLRQRAPGHPVQRERRHRRGPPARRRRRHREPARAGRDRPGDHRDRDPPAAGHPAACHRCDRRHRAACRHRASRARLTWDVSALNR